MLQEEQPSQQPSQQPSLEAQSRPSNEHTEVSPKKKYGLLESISNILEKIRSLVFSILVIFLFVIVCIFFLREIKKDYIIIEPFETPESIVKDGYTGSVVAKQLLDEINKVKKYAVDSAYYGYSVESINLIATTDKSEINFEVPVAGINLNSLIFFVRDYLDKDPNRISGEVLIHSDSLKINVRYGDLVTSVNTPKNQLNKEFENVAINILKEFQPLMIVNYYLAKKKDTLSEYVFKNINFKKKDIDSIDIKFFEGIFFFKQKKLTEAYDRFEYVYRKNPDNIEALKNIGLVVNDLNKPDEAERLYRKLIQIDPNDYISLQRLAQVLYIQDKNHTEIENLLNRVIKINPDLGDSYYYLASIKLEEKNYRQAKQYIDKSLKIDSTDYYNYIKLGSILTFSGDYKNAEIAYKKAIKINPNELAAYSRLSEIYSDNNQLEKSEYMCNIILAKNKYYANAYSMKGQLYSKKKMYVKAEEMYRKAFTVAPNDVTAYLEIGSMLDMQGKPKDAENLYLSALKLYPKYAYAYNRLAKFYYKQGKMLEAENNFRKAVTLKDDDAILHYNLATALKENSKFKEAEKELRVTLDLNGKFADAYNVLGLLVENSGNLSEAEKMYRRAIRYDSTQYAYYSNLGNLLESEEKSSEAAEMYKKAIRIDTSDSDVFLDLGLSLFKLNKLDEAKISYKKSIRLNSKNVNAHYALALLIKDEEPKEAEELLRTALKFDNNSIFIRNSLAEILSKNGKIDESQSLLKASVIIDSSRLETYYQMAINFCKKGDFTSAEKLFLFATKKDAKYISTIVDINYLFNKSYYNKVRGTYSNLNIMSYDKEEAYFWLAKILERKHNYEYAILYYNMSALSNRDYKPAYTAAKNLLDSLRRSTGYHSLYKIRSISN